MLILCLAVPALPANAEESSHTIVAAIEDSHEAISEQVIETAEWLDSFFADERYEAEAQTTQVKLQLSLFAETGDRAEYDFDERLRLSLPAFSNRFQLQISADEEETDVAERVAAGRRRNRERGFVASVRYFFRDSVNANVSLRTGIRLRGGMPVLFLEPRYRQNVPGPWMFRFAQRVMGHSDGELTARTIVDLERPLSPPDTFFFRTTVEGLWSRNDPGYSYSLSFSLFQMIDDRQVLEYAWGSRFQTSPNHRLEDTRLTLIYRRNIGWDWLFLEFAPQVGFPYDRNRRPTPAIRLQLEAVFGAWKPKNRPPGL